MSETPTGMVAILTRSDGSVVATAADFGGLSPGYSEVTAAQELRSRAALANAMVRDLCVPDIAEVMQGYDAERLLDKLCQRKGYRVTVISAS